MKYRDFAIWIVRFIIKIDLKGDIAESRVLISYH